MSRKNIFCVLVTFIGLLIGISFRSGWSFQSGMGVDHELAEAVNAATLNLGSGQEQVELAHKMFNEYYGTTGVKGDFDHDGIPDNQQSSAPAATTQPSQQKETTTEKTEEPKTEKTEEPEETPEVHEHDYIKEITKEPTCTEEGLATYTCECGDSYTEPIPAKGHTEGTWETISEPTCTEEGKKQIKCTTCGEVLKEESIPAKGHVEGDWEVTKPADWIHNGEQVKKCTVCNEILETEVLPANHTPLFIIGGAVVLAALISIVLVSRSKRSVKKVKGKNKSKVSDQGKTEETESMSTADNEDKGD